MNNNFLGRGWKFPVRVNNDGSIAMSEYEEDVREAIIIILGTVLGERVMRPDYGAGLQNHVFALLNSRTFGDISFEVREALVLWEPRIELQKAEVLIENAEKGQLSVSIDYENRSTNNVFNLVYPFFLAGSET